MLAYRAPQTAADWVIFGSIFAIVIAFSLLSAWRHKRRRAALLSAAQGLGLERVDPKSPDGAFIAAAVKGQRGHKLRACAVGLIDGRAARLAEFTFLTGAGKYTKTHYNLQLSLECPEAWPKISLSDRPDFMNRPISQLFRKPKPVTDDAEFERRWSVQDAGEEEARRLLSAETRALLLAGDAAESWSIRDGWLTCTWRRACTSADLPRLAERARAVHGALASQLGG